MKQCLILLMMWTTAAIFGAANPPDQPIPFSHKAHAGNLKLKCKMCHPNPDPGEAMRIAVSSVCMQCHSTIKAEAPAIQKLAALTETRREIQWVRVYEIPTYVQFSHELHLQAGSTSEECHGRVAEREQLSREADISMGGCMNCHRARKVSIDCTFCHGPQ